MRVELRHLRAVCAIADAGSVTKAAARLGLAPPALTTQLQRIERIFGGKLFHRDHTGVRPTELGELVLARARVLLPAAQGLEDEANRLATARKQQTGLRIGAVNGPLIGGLVSRLLADQPETRISTSASWSSRELQTMVLEERLDFALIGACGEPAESVLSPQLQWHLVADAPVFVLVGEDHPLAAAEEIPLELLADSSWVATPGDGCFGDCFAMACARAGFTPKSLMETDLSGCMDLVAAGAVALCQPTFRESPGIVVVPLVAKGLHWRHLVGWRPDSPAAPAADQIIRHAADAYTDAVGRSRAYVRWLQRHSSQW